MGQVWVMELSPRFRVPPSPMFLAELASSHPVSRRKVHLHSCLSETPGKRFGLAKELLFSLWLFPNRAILSLSSGLSFPQKYDVLGHGP